jgi:hypothetical protein
LDVQRDEAAEEVDENARPASGVERSIENSLDVSECMGDDANAIAGSEADFPALPILVLRSETNGFYQAVCYRNRGIAREEVLDAGAAAGNERLFGVGIQADEAVTSEEGFSS